MNYMELIAFIAYMAIVLAIGIYFFIKTKGDEGEKGFFLGGRNMNGLVAALSAGASDMSAWVLMGLPGSIYLYGMGQVWISIGLFIGTVLAWILVAPRLRRFSIAANDSITIPQYLTNRFKSASPALQIVSACVFVIVYCIYAASSIYACGTLFNTVFGMKEIYAMMIATVVIISYTFLGGFSAVCWTDFVQGMLMLAALMICPIAAAVAMKAPTFVAPALDLPDHYYNLLSSGKFDYSSVADIITGLGWGLGYFGMPHILVRFLSIKSEKEMKKSQITGCVWTGLILLMATVVAIVGRHYLGTMLADNSKLLFITMVRNVFPPLIAGVLLSAILAASMSTADSQLLASSSAFASDVFKAVFYKKASDSAMLWAGRIVVAVIAVIAFFIASSPSCEGIMALVECAWGAFGASFGPVILLSLFWKRFTYKGALVGIIVGFLTDAIWYVTLSGPTGIYEIVPGFIAGLVCAIVVSLIDKAPSEDVLELFDKAQKTE